MFSAEDKRIRDKSNPSFEVIIDAMLRLAKESTVQNIANFGEEPFLQTTIGTSFNAAVSHE